MSKQEMIEYLRVYLKQRGYKKQKQTWHRINQDRVYVIVNVQNSQWDRETYYINLGAGIDRQSTLKSLHRSILEKVRGHSTDTPRHTLKHPHGRTSLRRKTEQGVSSSRFSACAGSQKRPDAFQVSSRRSNRSSRIYGSMRTLPETKEPVRCCMRS